jgi:hypothetical protein
VAGRRRPSVVIIVGLMAIRPIDTSEERLLHVQERHRDHDLPGGVHRALVLADRPGHVPARAHWVLLRLRVLGRQNRALNNINLSEIIWIKVLKRGLPNFWLWREMFGLIIVGFYVVALPLVFSKTLLRRFFEKMGMARYMIGVNLALIMLSLPIKMYLRWIFNLKYIVNIPEFAFNI